MARFSVLPILAGLLFGLAGTGRVAAHPVDDLLKVAPADAHVYAVARDLRELAGSDWKTRFGKIAILKQILNSNEVNGAIDTVTKAFAELGTTPEEVRDELFGDALVFSYTRSLTGKDEDDRSLILGHARDAKLADRVVRRVTEVQIRNKELGSLDRVEKGAGALYRRMRVDGSLHDVIYVEGHFFAMTGHEAMLEECLARRGEKKPSAIPALYKSLNLEASPVSLFLNPRALDGELAKQAKAGSPADQAFLAQLLPMWHALDGVGVGISLKPDVELGLTVRCRTAELPEPVRRFLQRAATRNPMWDHIGPDPLFAMALRFDLDAFATTLTGFLPKADRAKLGNDFADVMGSFFESGTPAPLLKGLGHDVGLWMLPPKPESETWVPRLAAAVRFEGSPEGIESRDGMLKGLEFLGQLASVTQKEIRLKKEKQGETVVQLLHLPAEYPKGLRPAFAAKESHVIVASSPEVIADFAVPSSTTPAPTPAGEVPLMRISLAAWRAYSKTHGPAALAYFAKTSDANNNPMAKIRELVANSDGIDRLDLALRIEKDLVTLVLRLTLTK
jgi:hypothetical protein